MDSDVTQVLEPTEVQTAADTGGPPDGGRPGKTGTGGRFPRRWIFPAIVIALLLVAGFVAFALAERDEPGEVVVAEVLVPDVRGMTLGRAGDEVTAAGLEPGSISYAVVDESVMPSGTVLTQDPLPGVRVAPGTKLDIVMAQGPSPAEVAVEEAVAQVEAQQPSASTPSDAPSGTGGSSSPPPPEQPPALPELPPAESIDVSKIQPNLLDPGMFKLVQPQYKTLIEQDGFGSSPWQSPAITFGDKPKRVWITADGPYNVPVAVWAWGPNDSTWKLKTVWASYPGAFENPDGTGGTLVQSFDVGAGTYTILVRVNADVSWWKVRVEEQK